jgi:ParB family chromosome partitioning protein
MKGSVGHHGRGAKETTGEGWRMKSIISVNSFRCKMWELHDRIETTVTESSCRAEIDSIRRYGQLVPALGRRLRDDADYDIELIYGARRLFVARHLMKELLVEVRDISDREALVAMDLENRQRVDISPYERGVSYSRWLREKHFASQDDISRALRISASQVSRLLRIARLPAVIVSAFGSPADICEGWGLDLAEVLENEKSRDATVRCARAISARSTRTPGKDVYRELMAASAGGKKVKAPAHDEVVTAANGSPLFRVRHQINTVALVLPLKSVSSDVLARVKATVSEVLSNSA